MEEGTLIYQSYPDHPYESERLIWNLLGNAYRTIRSVYLFQHFEEYCFQLHSVKQEDKGDVYWNASYHEKLIDYIKISLAFETHNKAVLLKNGFVVHQINPKFNKALRKKQSSGRPVHIEEFLMGNSSILPNYQVKGGLNGLLGSFSTISYHHTLNNSYQKIIQLDFKLLLELKNVNLKRNKLHFFTDFIGAFSVNQHIEKWKYIMNKSHETIQSAYTAADKRLKEFD